MLALLELSLTKTMSVDTGTQERGVLTLEDRIGECRHWETGEVSVDSWRQES